MVGYWQSLSRSLFFRFLDYPWKKCRNRLTLYLKRTLIITTNLPIKYDTPAKALGSGALRKFLECIVKRNVGTNNTNNIVTRSITGGVTARPFTTAQSSQPSVHRTSQNFDEMIKRRHLQAKKSVLVEVNSRYVFHDLCEYCQQFGHVKYAIHYRIKNEKEVFIFEFENSEVVKNLLTQCSHPEDDEIVPVHSHLLLYGSEALNHDSSCQSLFESVNPPTQAEILRDLLEARNISEQMIKLHLSEQLSDLGSRLRFLICSQLEEALSGMFPNCQVLPFGSSVNGFGKNFCDLDMLLSLNTVQNNPTSRLKFQTKKAYANDRMQTQRTLETVGDILQNFLPGIVQVQRILQARVPILKFHHIPTGIYCDLSISNKNGVLMSKLLYMCSELDPHIQPLMYTIRKWARENHLTHDVPGRWISNFSLSLMVLFFLQARSQPLLLPLMDLVCIAGKSDKTLPDDMEYISQKGLKHPPSEKTEDLEILLKEFFLFYEKFNFKERGLSLTTGHSMVKPDYSPLYIENPLEQELNVSKNVSSEEMERFSTCVRTALWKLELNNIKNSDDLWGILKLFDPKAAENQSNPQTVKGFQLLLVFWNVCDELSIFVTVIS
ncbi:poly(A) RNA polymerase, mitochondrial-like isoform X2 [Tachypleus tridentatus]|uniref:poly(A) RNA polymerase, mitochondrial-like isoform X2 n=1 Tax=Tachypleus tridentatus TaxID=6853 RepID=UPI003FCFB0AD